MPAVEASSVLTVATAPAGEGPPQSALQVSRAARVKSLWNALRDSVIGEKATGGTELTGHLDQPELCDMEQVAKELRASWMRGNEENEEAAKALEEILNAALSEDQEQGTGQKLQALNDFARRKNAGGGLSSTDFNCAFPKDGRITFDTTASNIVFEANARETALISKDDLESFTFFTPLWFRQQLLSHGKSNSDRERVKKIAGMLIQARRKSTGDGGCQRIAQAVAERLRTGSIMFTELEYEAFKHILSAALREEENAATLEKFKQLFEEVAPDVWQQVKKFYWDSGECSTAKIVFEKETGNIVFDTTKLGDTIEPKTILIEGDALKNFKFYGYNGNEKKNAYRDTRQFASALNTSAALNEIRETGGEGGLLKLLGQAREELTGGNCQTQDMEQLQNVFRGFWGEGKFDRQTVNSGLQPLANDVLVEYLEHAGGLAAETSAWPKLRKFVKRTLDCQIATSQGIASEWRRGDSWQRFAVEMGETTLLDYSAGSFNPSPEERFLGPLSFRKALSEAMWKPKYGEESSHAPRKNLECLMDVAYKRSSGNIKEPTGGAAFNDCMMGKITNDLKNAWSGSSKFAGETDEENSDGARALKEILQSSIGIENEEKMVSLGTFFMKKKFPIAEKFPIAGVDGTIETGWRAKIGWSQTQTLRTHTHYPETDTSIVLRLEKTADGGKLKEYKLIELFDLKMGQDNSASGRIERDAEYPKFAEALQQRDRNTGDKAIAGELLCLLKAADEKARNMDKEAQALAVAPYREGRSEEKDIQHLRNVELPNPEDYDKAAQAKFRKCQGEQGQECSERAGGASGLAAGACYSINITTNTTAGSRSG
ncbi:unnamed protein product [Amoebophrya sp. A25]|nr:unnamed protein product [Amoebophrya sp. A25]|eukprot:GSA25T00027337001.1